MKLYHGTTEEIARLSPEEGLLPRAESGVETTWPDCPSREDMVYLTRAYAPYFAMTAAEKDARWGLVEIDTEVSPELWDGQEIEDYLFPDEDFLEQGSRNGTSPCPEGLDMEERTAWFRENLLGFQHHWKDSIEGLGNCAHLGEIPAECVTQVVLFEPKSNPPIAMTAADPAISILNYRLLGGTKYRALTDWFFGLPVDPGMLEPGLTLEVIEGFQKLDPKSGAFFAKRREAWSEILANREGIELLL